MDVKQYIKKYKLLIDLILIYYLKNNFNYEFSDNTLLNYFNNNVDLNCNNLKNKILNEYREISDFEELEGNIYLPFRKIFKIFNFNLFGKFCFCLGLFSGIDSKYKMVIATLQNFCNDEVTLSLVADIFKFLELDFLDFLSDFNEMQLTILGLDSEENKNKPLMEKVISINSKIQSVIYEFDEFNDNKTYLVHDYDFELIDEVELLPEIDEFFYNLFSDNKLNNNRINILVINGRKGSGKRTQIWNVSYQYKLRPILINFKNLMRLELNLQIVELKNFIIDAYTLGGFLCFYDFKLEKENKDNFKFIFSFLQNYLPFAVVLTEDLQLNIEYMSDDKILIYHAKIPDLTERKRLAYWQKFLVDKEITLSDYEKLARGFVLTVGDIKNICLKYCALKGKDYFENLLLLRKLCIDYSNYNFGQLAIRVNYNITWDDIILNLNSKEKLKEVCNRIKYKDEIYEEWGFNKKIKYGKGTSVLFYGPSGTGKTMAASVLSSSLGCELYKVNLPQIVDKYVGETEKNLKNIFDVATKTNVILFFDEADAIFSKRTDVTTSNDKYSNVEVAYLLQQIEEYEGIIILATNFLSGFDEAFKRRIDFIIKFDLPDKDSRLLLWQKSFPRQTKLAEDVDFLKLAEKYELTGSSIQSVAVSAAFYAIKDEKYVCMKHIKKALIAEFEKNGKAFLDEDFDTY